jgi:hydrogenase nickel incorporation protein HypA/HybF
MHEISIAQNIIEIAQASARAQNAVSIQLIKIRLGDFTNIVREALEFAFEIAREGTMAEHAELDCEIVHMEFQCVVCKAATEPSPGCSFICIHCGFPLKLVAGEELQIDYVDVVTEGESFECKETLKEFQFRPIS